MKKRIGAEAAAWRLAALKASSQPQPPLSKSRRVKLLLSCVAVTIARKTRRRHSLQQAPPPRRHQLLLPPPPRQLPELTRAPSEKRSTAKTAPSRTSS